MLKKNLSQGMLYSESKTDFLSEFLGSNSRFILKLLFMIYGVSGSSV